MNIQERQTFEMSEISSRETIRLNSQETNKNRVISKSMMYTSLIFLGFSIYLPAESFKLMAKFYGLTFIKHLPRYAKELDDGAAYQKFFSTFSVIGFSSTLLGCLAVFFRLSLRIERILLLIIHSIYVVICFLVFLVLFLLMVSVDSSSILLNISNVFTSSTNLNTSSVICLPTVDQL